MAFPTFSGMVFEFQRAFREPRLQGAGRSIMSAVSLSQASIIQSAPQSVVTKGLSLLLSVPFPGS